jgi:hypothetical protein
MSIARKFFYASLIICIVSLLFLGIYRLSFYKPAETAQVKKEEIKPAALPDQSKKETSKIFAISDEAILSPVLSPDGLSIKYYSQKNGRAYQIDLDGTNKKEISDKDLIGLSSAIWSPDKTKVITKFVGSGGDVQFYYYNYSTGISTPLKKNLDEVSWDGTGNKIFYKYYDPASKERTLNIADPDGKNWKKLADLSYKNVAIAPVPQSGMVSFWNKADSLSTTDMESIPVIGGEKKVIYKEKFGADYLWNSSGTNILINHVDVKGGSKMQLALLNFNGGEYTNLGVPTFISKCTWSSDNKTIYYSLPGNIQSTAVLPNEYNEGVLKTSDTFWKIDLASKQPKRIVELEDLQKVNIQFDAANLFLSSDEGYLFFTNKLDGKIYRMSL